MSVTGNDMSWYPESVYTIDICESEGELYVLELGSFSCAGEYAFDTLRESTPRRFLRPQFES
jgi:hypothetical protein